MKQSSSKPALRGRNHGPSLAAVKAFFGFYLPLAMLALIPVLGDYLLNAYQLSVQEIVLPLALNLLVAAIIAAFFYRWRRRDRLGSYVAAALATIMLTNGYDMRFSAIEGTLQALLPIPRLGDPVFSLIFMAGILLASFYLGRAANWLVGRHKWNAQNITGAMTIAIAVTFILQAVPTIRDLAVAWPQFFYRPPQLAAASKSAAGAAKPDIYYLIADRYASPAVLSSQFNFDDSDFTNYLADNQFYVHGDAHQNYPFTSMSVASTLSANYNGDLVQKFAKSSAQTVIPYNLTIRRSPVVAYLKSIGYRYDLLANWYETSNMSGLADSTFQEEGLLTFLNHTYIIDNFQKDELANGLFWRFIQPGLAVGNFNLFGYSNADMAKMTLDQLADLRNLAAQPAGGRFIFAHLLVPHDPYFFNADGSLNVNNSGDNSGEPIKQKYINQVKFINGQLEAVLTAIKQNSHGTAAVILQSDEGPYPLDLNDGNFDITKVADELAGKSMLNWSDQNLKMKFGNFAAYYVPGANTDDLAAGGTSVNAFRLVLNTLFGQQLPYLPDCYYAYPAGRSQPFVYANINQRLTGQANPACSKDGRT